MRAYTIGHGTRPVEELVTCLLGAGIETLVDVRRFPGSRRNPQFNQTALAETLDAAAQAAVEALGGDFGAVVTPESGDLTVAGSYELPALAGALAEPAPCFMCAETPWWRCHRRLIAELLTARGDEIVHLLRPGDSQAHRLYDESTGREGKLYLCGELVA